MTARRETLGDCPYCGEDALRTRLLVEYRRSDGSTGRYADCPSCDDVVTPQ